MLPNIEQFHTLCPRAGAITYCDANSVVQHSSCEVLASEIVEIVPTPTVILQWDSHTDTFKQISLQVHHMPATLTD